MNSPYLEKKGIDLKALQAATPAKIWVAESKIKAFQGQQEYTHTGLFLFRETVNAMMERVGLERILDKRVVRHIDGSKPNDKFLKYGSSTDGFTPFGFTPKNLLTMEEDIIVCAGLADGYRLHEATGRPVACCVGEANIPKVAQQISALSGRSNVMVAVDNDKAGMLAAHRSGLPYLVPRKAKDFSDVYQEEGGVDAVRWQAEVPFQTLPSREREAEVRRLSGQSANDYQPPRNSLGVEKADGVGLGVVAAIEVAKPHLINGYEQFKQIGESWGCFFKGDVDNGKPDTWLLSEPKEIALGVAMLDEGLRASLPVYPLLMSTMEFNLFNGIREGALDNEPIPGGAPALVNPGRDKYGPCLVLDMDYDEDIIHYCREAGGFFDKDKNEWRLSLRTEKQRDRVVSALTGNPLERFVFNMGTKATPNWVIGNSDNRQKIAKFISLAAPKTPGQEQSRKMNAAPSADADMYQKKTASLPTP